MRWYRIYCIDCRETTRRSPETIYAHHRVEVEGGVVDAWDKAKADGYWPLYVLDNDWMPATLKALEQT